MSSEMIPYSGQSLISVFLDPSKFEQLQRAAKVFSASPLVPDHMRKEPANCIIALALAGEMRENPLVVMQHIHFVSGKAGWSAQYMIARANKSGIFKGRINWRVEGKGDSLSVTAYATLTDTGEEVTATADMAMAKKENWVKNAKYQSMPEVMLRYRSATFLVRWHCPEVMFGYQTIEEVEDVAAAHPPANSTVIDVEVDMKPEQTTKKGVEPNEPEQPDQPLPEAEESGQLKAPF